MMFDIGNKQIWYIYHIRCTQVELIQQQLHTFKSQQIYLFILIFFYSYFTVLKKNEMIETCFVQCFKPSQSHMDLLSGSVNVLKTQRLVLFVRVDPCPCLQIQPASKHVSVCEQTLNISYVFWLYNFRKGLCQPRDKYFSHEDSGVGGIF